MITFEILISLVSGVLSGVIATWIFWWYNNIYLRPKICVSTEISFNKATELFIVTDNLGNKKVCSKEVPQYKIKIINQSKRVAYDIKSYIRIRYKEVFATIALPHLPVLHGKTDEDSFDNERDLPFCMTELQLPKISSLNNPELLDKYMEGKLLLEDFNDKDTLLEIILFATDSKSGAVQRLTSIKRSFDDIIRTIKPGNFIPGKLIIGKGNQEARN